MKQIAPIQKTVIMHFHNEEYMLPWWIKHHVKVFDHGVLINHGSTDASADICRELVPHWQLVDSELSEFSAVETDLEVMRYEAASQGWKMALNATEFLVCTPELLDKKLQLMNSKNQKCLQTRGVVMADIAPDQKPSKEIPLIAQKHHGYLEQDHPVFTQPYANLRKLMWNLRWDRRARKGVRHRVMHCYAHGDYTVGRHATSHRIDARPSDIFTFWYGYSPWNDDMVARKLQFKSRIPQADREQRLGFQHLFDEGELSDNYRSCCSKSRDLSGLLP